MAAFELAQIFQDHPLLERLSFDSTGDDSGWDEPGPLVLLNQEAEEYQEALDEGYDYEPSADASLRPARERALAWVDELGEELRGHKELHVFERPASGVSLADHFMAQWLGAEEFARWQAGALRSESPQAKSAPAKGI